MLMLPSQLAPHLQKVFSCFVKSAKPLHQCQSIILSLRHSSSLCISNTPELPDSINQPKLLKKRTIFSGIQPTGVLHLGNYFGAVKQWVELQESGENVIYSVVDLHSITLPQDPKILHDQILNMAASLIACGIEPSKAILFQQSRVKEHVELQWILTCLSTMARLGQLPQFKEKTEAKKEIPLGLFVYPVLQSADILLYHATHIPVGEDQLQHIQLAAHLARLFNNKFGKTFRSPHSMVIDDSTARIRSLRQPTKKMSKSEADPKSRIEISDSPDIICDKLKKAVTDCTSAIYYDLENRPGVSNLMAIHSGITGQSYNQIQTEYSAIDTGAYKLVLADIVVEYLKPVKKKLDSLLNDKAHLNQLLDEGANKAQKIARKTMEDVRKRVGFSA